MKKRVSIILSVIAVVIAGAGAWWPWNRQQPHPDSQQPGTQETTPAPATNQQTNATPAPAFDKTRYSITDSSSLWTIANKKHPLSVGYAPAKIVVPNVPLRLENTAEQMHVSSVMAPHLEALFAGAQKDGINLKLSSGYRSEALQKQLYDSYVAKDGQAAADTYSARPGTSEHQTGLAADIIPINDACHLETCFADTPEGKWLAAHAHEYGFIIRYPKGKESETTYQYEPWHVRYVGDDLANELFKNGLTMEEFFNYQ